MDPFSAASYPSSGNLNPTHVPLRHINISCCIVRLPVWEVPQRSGTRKESIENTPQAQGARRNCMVDPTEKPDRGTA
jgi:hypothetical protein